ncbi:MAG: hypothetical protein WB612_01825 [Nitrososphaeraceae archaeon]
MKTRFYLVLMVVAVILGSIGSAYDSTKIFAQDATGNAPDSTKGEGAIVEWQSCINLPLVV